jgi:hypothetical protein
MRKFSAAFVTHDVAQLRKFIHIFIQLNQMGRKKNSHNSHQHDKCKGAFFP